MITYFAKFPTIAYPSVSANGFVSNVYCRDIMQRAKVRKFLNNNALIFYPYTVCDGETPEIISHRLYGSTNFFWIVLLPNMVLDSNYEWPMSNFNFKASLRQRYSAEGVDGVRYAIQTTHHYEDYNGNIIDLTTFESLPFSQRTLVTIFDYLNGLNEARRSIRVLDKRYAQQVDIEMDKVMRSPIA